MIPYDDADLLSLLRERSALRGGGALPPVGNWRGHLAPALCRAGLADAAQVEQALEVLERHVTQCARCGLRFCLLPMETERLACCPKCQNRWSIPAREAIGAAHEGPSKLHPSWNTGSVAGSSGLGPVAGAPRGLEPGDTVGPYVVIREMARGAMGIVLKCRHKEFKDRAVAVKIMQAQFADEEDLERFRREGEALARLDHPNVVRVHDLALMEDGRPYLALDFVQGQTLEDLVADGPLPPEKVAAILADVARGTAHLHRNKIIHRDLKLANVLLDAGGRPVIADFGLVHMQDRNTRLTEAGDLLGTPLYMPPEVILREEEGYDGRVDVYAIGIMAYRMIVGDYPYYSKNHTELFTQILEADLKLPEDLPHDVLAVLERALARDPDERYPDADALAADLRALATGQEVSTRRAGAEERLRRWAKLNPRLAYGLPIGLVALLTLTLGLMLGVKAWTRSTLLADLETQAAALEQIRQELQTRDLNRTLEQIQEQRDLAEAALKKGRSLGDAGQVAVERLESVFLQLEGAQARVAVLDALERSGANFGEGGIQSLLEPALKAPPGPAEEPLSRVFEGRRAWILLACGRSKEAAEALAPIVASDRALTAGDDWTGPEGVRRIALAWAQARAGAFLEAEEALKRAPGDLRAELLLFVASCHDEPALRRGAVAEAERALDASSLQGRVLAAQARWLGLRERSRAALLDRLAELREVSDPPRLGEIADTVRAAALRVEAQVLVELGWSAEAARAFARALELAPGEVTRAVRLATASGPRVLPADGACALGEAQARARLVDGARAIAAARRARQRLLGQAGAFEAGVLLLEALEVQGQVRAAGEAERLRAALASEASEAARGVLDALALREARRRGEGEGADGAGGRWLTLGFAELAVCEGLRDQRQLEGGARAAERARRAFLLGIGEGAGPRAWAGLALAELARDQPASAQSAAKRATQRSDPPWEGLLARALVRAGAGERGPAVDDLFAALDVLEAASFARPAERFSEQQFVLRLGEGALLQTDSAGDAALLRFRLRASELVGRWKLSPRVRYFVAKGAEQAAIDVGDDAAQRRAVRMRDAAGRDERRIRELTQKLQREIDKGGQRHVALSAARPEWVLEQISISPFDYSHYHNYAINFAVAMAQDYSAFDTMVLAHEMDPLRAVGLMQGNTNRYEERAQGGAKWLQDAVRAMLPKLMDDAPPFKHFPQARDGKLRFALATVRNRMQGVEVERSKLLRGLDGAQEIQGLRPRLGSAAFIQGFLRGELGDREGALLWLERTESMLPPFVGRGEWVPSIHPAWVERARILARQRRWKEAAVVIDPALQYYDWTDDIRSDPSFWEDREDKSSLGEPFVQAIEKIKRRMEQEKNAERRGH